MVMLSRKAMMGSQRSASSTAYWLGPFRFETDQPGPLPSTYTEEGAVGQLVLYQLDGNLSTSGGALVLPGQGTGDFTEQGYLAKDADGNGFLREAGMAYICSVSLSVISRTIIGMASGAVSSGSPINYLSLVDKLGLYPFAIDDFRTVGTEGTNINNLGAFAANTKYQLALVLGAERDFFLRDNEIVWVQDAGETETVCPILTNFDSDGAVSEVCGVLLGAPWNAAWDRATAHEDATSDGQIVAGNADGITEHRITAQTGVTQELQFRSADDNNSLIVRCNQSANTIALIKREEGSETSLASAVQTWTNNTQYQVKVRHFGESLVVYVNDAQMLATTSVYNQSAIGVKVSHAGTELACWPRFFQPSDLLSYARQSETPVETRLTWEGDDFTIVMMPDTQSYTQAMYEAQTSWIAANAEALNIQMVLHVGDVVNGGNDLAQWAAADAAMSVLDAASVPYLVTTGNHDDDQGESYPLPRSVTNFNATFPQSRFTSRPGWDGGFYEADHSENAYRLKTISGRDYLFLMLEFGPRQAVVDWANALIAQYPNRDVILTTHCLVYHDDSLVGAGDAYNPHNYAGVSSDTHDGDELWAEMIRRNRNLILALSGHELGDGTGRLTRWNLYGRQCHMILANYQWPILLAHESGYLRLVTVKPSTGDIEMTTYSPLLDNWLTSDDQEYTLLYPSV